MSLRQPQWRLVAACAAACALLLLAASSRGLAALGPPRRLLLSPNPQPGAGPPGSGSSPRTSPAAAAALERLRLAAQLRSGRVGGSSLRLPPGPGPDAAATAHQRCRGPEPGAPPLPQLTRQAGWEGDSPAKDGNVTVVTSLHVDQLTLLEVHCAVWPHKIMAAVYAPVTPAGHVACPAPQQQQQQQRDSGLRAALAWLGLGRLGAADAACPYAGWPLEQLKRAVRAQQKRAQQTGLCNLQLELFTEVVTPELGPAGALLPQAALQNRALLALKPEVAAEHAAVVLLDGDMVSVDVWQLANWPSRWARAVSEMQSGKVLVMPAFQLSPAGASAALDGAQARDTAVMEAALDIVTAEAGKFPLRDLYTQGAVQPLADRGFAGSQAAALPALWFEAGDMHGAPDDGYPVLPQPGFAPFVFTLQRHVPWADERLRGSYYQRAWQAVAQRALGLQHVVQPNVFSLQLPHPAAYSRDEAAWGAFKQMEPVLQQLVKEAGSGTHVPVTAFADSCKLHDPPKHDA